LPTSPELDPNEVENPTGTSVIPDHLDFPYSQNNENQPDESSSISYKSKPDNILLASGFIVFNWKGMFFSVVYHPPSLQISLILQHLSGNPF
jgi:hypothetical protein